MATNNAKTIASQISAQESEMLRKGRVPGDGSFSTIRQRHIWSAYCFTNGSGGAVQPATNLPGNFQINPNVYRVFRAAQGDTGQGLPAGFNLNCADTDFLGQGRMPDQQNFAVWDLGVSVLPMRQDVTQVSPLTRGAGPLHPDDVERILEEGILRVKYITEEVSLGHLADFAQPGGPQLAVPTLLDFTAEATGIVGPPAGIVGGEAKGTFLTPPYQFEVPRTAQNSGNMAPSPATRRKLDVPIFLPARTQFEFQIVFKRPVWMKSLEGGGTLGCMIRVDLWVVESYRAVS